MEAPARPGSCPAERCAFGFVVEPCSKAQLVCHLWIHYTDLSQLKRGVLAQARALYQNMPSMPNPASELGKIIIAEPGKPDWVLTFHPIAVVKELIVAHSRFHHMPWTPGRNRGF